MSLPVSEAARPADASLSLQFDDADADLLARAFRTPGDGPRAWALNGEAHRISLINGFDRLLAWPTLRGVVRYPHQERTCLRVLREMRGRAILADEVGLGKTIEAGLLLKEYTIRGLVRRALILTPASLTGQWREEMESKFELPFAVLRSVGDWERRPLLVASIDTAKRDPHRVWAQRTSWDLVIVDEAHRLKNRLSVNWRFVAGLSKKYMLLLTATPVQDVVGRSAHPDRAATGDREQHVRGRRDAESADAKPALRRRRAGTARGPAGRRPGHSVEREGGSSRRLPPILGRKGLGLHPVPADDALPERRPRRRRASRRHLSRRTPACGQGRRRAVLPRGGTDLLEHGGGRRGPEPAVRADGGELRPALESPADRAADRARAPSRADARGPRREPVGPGHGRGLSHGTPGPEDPHVRARRRRAGLDPGDPRRAAVLRGHDDGDLDPSTSGGTQGRPEAARGCARPGPRSV